ncbi:MAG: YARHG domain-containing protein [Desulfobacteraceae bacterium]|nr:MAG: YARHG domain-containing protein [Desulfobacteraceae bacterium]
MLNKILLIIFSFLSFVSISFAQPDQSFIRFIDKFAQNPFLLEGSEEYYVSELSKAELNILRNTIFARHGYIFKKREIETFFMARSWYKPISKTIKLTEIDQKNLNFIMMLENPEKIRFADFLKLFHHAKLPIIINTEKYGEDYSKRIPIYYVKKYFDMCCPDIQAIDQIYSNAQFVAVLYGVHWAGVQLGVRTYGLDGKMISTERIAVYAGDLSSVVTSIVKIDDQLNIETEIQENQSHEDNLENATQIPGNITTIKYLITQNGQIIKR